MGRKYMYDVQTRNISFIQTAVDLKKLGIKNNMFFLKLYDTSLQSVDPFDPDLSKDQIIRIVNECIINPWYFLRECVRIPDQGNPMGIPYALNRATLALTWLFLLGIDSYTTIPRQIGKTQSAIAIINWGFLFGTTNSEIMFINMDFDKAGENLTRLRDQRALLPEYLQFKIAFDDDGNVIKGPDNVKTLKSISNGNKIVIKPSATSLAKAEKIGRGSTQSIQYFDEFEFMDYNKTIVEASGPAFKTASDNARRNNAMYGRIFTSTPGDLDSRAGADAEIIIENTYRWSESLYDKYASEGMDAVKEIIELNSSNRIVYIEYSYKQLGKDEKWFTDICALINNNPMKIKREIFLMRLHGSSMSPYPAEDLDAIREKQGEIIEEIYINKLFKIELYAPLQKNRCYFVGVDVANGYGADNSGVTIWDPYTRKTVGEFKSPNIGVKALIKFLYVLVKKHLPKSILCIERNANGEAVLDHLRDTDIRPNIYYDTSKNLVADSIDDKLDAQGLLKYEAARRRLYGVYTQGKSRELMFSILDNHVREYKENFIGRHLIDDLMKLVITRGKIQAGAGFHDDNIMSYLICLYVFYHGNNLHLFGFIKGEEIKPEDRNKGLTYDDVLNELSDSEKEYFKNTGYSSDSEYIENNIEKMIQQRGLITQEELQEEAGVQHKNSDMLSKMDPYSRKIYMEMLNAQKESNRFNHAHNINASYENMNDDIDDDMESIDMSIFDDLNS